MKLSELPCKNWAELVEYLPKHKIILLLSKDKRCIQVAKYIDAYGPECASAIACAMLCGDTSNSISLAHWALNVYKRISPERADEWRDFEFHLAWAGVPRELKWPIEPEFASEQEEAGMANVMFSLALEQMSAGSTSEKLAGMKIHEFLDNGMLAKEDKG